MKSKKAKELAIVTAYIQYNGLLQGTFFNTVDKAYKIAKNFVKIYPHNYKWIEEEYDETIEEFVKNFKF